MSKPFQLLHPPVHTIEISPRLFAQLYVTFRLQKEGNSGEIHTECNLLQIEYIAEINSESKQTISILTNEKRRFQRWRLFKEFFPLFFVSHPGSVPDLNFSPQVVKQIAVAEEANGTITL